MERGNRISISLGSLRERLDLRVGTVNKLQKTGEAAGFIATLEGLATGNNTVALAGFAAFAISSAGIDLIKKGIRKLSRQKEQTKNT